MSDLGKLALTIFFAAFGYVIVKFFMDPVHELRRVIVDVKTLLSLHAPVIHTPAARAQKASDEAEQSLRRTSAELIAKLGAVRAYGIFAALHVIPPKHEVEDAGNWLRALATYVHDHGDSANRSLETIDAIVARINRKLRIGGSTR